MFSQLHLSILATAVTRAHGSQTVVCGGWDRNAPCPLLVPLATLYIFLSEKFDMKD